MGAYVGNVCDPDLVRMLNCEFALQAVGCHSCGHSNSVALALVATYRALLGLTHHASDALFSAQRAIFTQIAMHAWTAVNTLASFKGLLYLQQQRFISQGAL